MGWTHSWNRPTELPAEAFAKASDHCRKILELIGVPLAGFDGTGEPIFTDDSIVFNGARAASCEPFEIHQTTFDQRGRQEFFEFVKTNRAPYDICVKAALIVLQHHLAGSLKVSSDGSDAEWSEARSTCQKHLGYGENFKLADT